jgi:microcin C transport system substrate-binding protein
MSCLRLFFLLSALLFIPGPGTLPCAASEPDTIVSHAIAMNGVPRYGPGFAHFDYVNPDAPKGGELRASAIGTFDSFNPFISKGVAATGMGLVYDTLTVASDDEPFTQYGLVAETIEYPRDRSWVVFHINPEARFQDGTPITAKDVVFSFDVLTDKANPLYRRYYANVTGAEAVDRLSVKFSFDGTHNQELPLIVGQLPVIPAHAWKDRDFFRTSLDIPVGSGPYRVAGFQAGRSVTYERVSDYWAADLPVCRGRYNFDRIRYDYYRDSTIALESFKAGNYDFRLETSAKDWATMYTGPAFSSGEIVKEEIKNELPQGMQCFAFNTRNPLFSDPRVRLALSQAFDFEWSNTNLFYGQYSRSKSYFSNSELASSGLPSPEELEVLEPFRDQLPPEVFTTPYEPPTTEGGHGIRRNLRRAMRLLKEAGWVVRDKKLVNAATNEPFTFEILLNSPAFERVALPFTRNLARLGIEASVRLVDTTQYVNRVRDFDFDMIVAVFGQSLSPGNEQRYFWHSSAADMPGSRNYMGIKNPVIDALVDQVITAPTRHDLVVRTRALDRVLLWGHYVIPHWHLKTFRVAYRNIFDRPAVQPRYDLGLFNWWVKP